MTQNNFKIAITGGIGSGKSTVSKFIKEQGYTVISCDDIYKNLLCDKHFLNKLSMEFGDIQNIDNTLDREKLSAIVFSDKQKLKRLNEITHPAILDEAFRQMSGEGIFFCEVPLLFESGSENLFDNVIVVLRDIDSRISSVTKRDGISENEVKSRINNQFDYDKSLFKKYYVIHNDTNLTDLHAQTINLIKNICEK